MDIRQLKTFKAVSMFLSFNKAAAHLNYAQSSISAQIQNLENELGVKLFDRLGRGIRLTTAGQRLLQYAEKILDLADASKADVAGTQFIRGTLTVRIPESVGVYRLPQVIARYAERHPEVRLNFTTCSHDTLQKDLRRGITDLAFLLTESIQASDLETEVVGFEPIVMVASPRHPLAKRKIVHTREIQGQSVLLSKVDCSYRRTFDRILSEAGAACRVVHNFHSVTALRHCVGEGMGITILPETAIKAEVARGDLAVVAWEDAFEVALLMIWYRERWLSPALKAFMRLTRKALDIAQGE